MPSLLFKVSHTLFLFILVWMNWIHVLSFFYWIHVLSFFYKETVEVQRG